MAVKLSRTSLADFRAQMQEAANRIDAAILLNLKRLGERCVNIARSLDTYQDQTGNLRSSVGYIILKDGNIVTQNFERNLNKKPGSGRRKKGYGKEGFAAGQEFAKKLAANFNKGYVLIVVAGMDYAAKVESTGKDVLTSAEQYAQKETPILMKQLTEGIGRMRIAA